jgi:hypothetical protein
MVRVRRIYGGPSKFIQGHFRPHIPPQQTTAIAGCNDVDPSSLAQSKRALDSVPYLPPEVYLELTHTPSMMSGATSLQGAITIQRGKRGVGTHLIHKHKPPAVECI